MKAGKSIVLGLSVAAAAGITLYSNISTSITPTAQCNAESEGVEETQHPRSFSSMFFSDTLRRLNNANRVDSEEFASKINQAAVANPDTVAWVYCEGLNIDYPVVQTDNNTDYLRTDFEGNYDVAGTIFLDARCNNEVAPWLKMVHGHNMKDGTMFAELPTLFQLDNIADVPTVQWYTPEDGLVNYKAISILSIKSDEEALPIDYFYSSEDMDKFITELIDRSVVKGDIVGETSNDLLILNTCWYGKTGSERNLHCLVVASRI